MVTELLINRSVLEDNDRAAAWAREHWRARGTLVVNLMSSPGAGKTALLEATLGSRHDHFPIGVIEGDLATDRDTQRIQRAGAFGLQITTGGACHLEAAGVWNAFESWEHKSQLFQWLFIENVGNLVCPAAFDLGEHLRVGLLAVTEGDDKPLKYPKLFRTLDWCVITKLDLLPHCQFDIQAARRNLKQIRPEIHILEVSAESGQGIQQWKHALHTFHESSILEEALD